MATAKKKRFKLTQKAARQALKEALLSGEYRQVTHRMKCDDGYCILGVACDLFNKIEGQGKWFHDGPQFAFKVGRDERRGTLPERVMQWLGFRSQAGRLSKIVNNYPSLVSMNDGGVKFKSIAEYIDLAKK